MINREVGFSSAVGQVPQCALFVGGSDNHLHDSPRNVCRRWAPAEQDILIAMTSFRFVSYRGFKRELGKTNAAVECAELSVRKFLHEAEKSEDASAFVKAASDEYRVRVDTLDPPLLKKLLAQLHITTVHQEFESFLPAMIREYRGKGVELEKGDSLLKGTLKDVFGSYDAGLKKLGRFEVETAEYYRLVRNSFAHDGSTVAAKADIPRLRELLEKLEDESYSRLSAPHASESVDFDDFILFSRVSKRLALQFCEVLRPTNARIAEMLKEQSEALGLGINLNKLGRIKQNAHQLRRTISNLLRTLYSLESQEADPIVDILVVGLLA
jgi:hypothetical protein